LRSASGVVEFVAVKAFKYLKHLHGSTRPLPFIQYKAVADRKYHQVSIGSGMRFGTRYPIVGLTTPWPFQRSDTKPKSMI
jgi:hypothetical protein